jgi:hypothetical protein
MKLVACLLFSIFFSITVHAQDSTLVLSAPIDISENGWNKLLQLKNGNTMLFHFELHKNILVKLYDGSGKEILSKKIPLSILDANMFDNDVFDGLFEGNGEVLLFISQELFSINSMVRIRINSSNLNLINEEVIVKSDNHFKTRYSYVRNKPWIDKYLVFSYDFAQQFADTLIKAKITWYDFNNKVISETPINIAINRDEYHKFLNIAIDDSGSVYLAFQNSKTIQEKYLYERNIAMVYIPHGISTLYYNTIKSPNNLNISGAYFTNNDFAQTINFFMVNNYNELGYRGIEFELVSTLFQYACVLPTDLSAGSIHKLSNEMSSAFIQKSTGDSSRKFEGAMVNYRTNDRGITTVFFEEYKFTVGTGHTASTSILEMLGLHTMMIISMNYHP